MHLTKKCFFSSEARLRLIASIKRVKSKRSLSELKNQVEDKSLKKLISSELENSKVRNKFEREALEKIARLESKTENLKNTKVKQVRL